MERLIEMGEGDDVDVRMSYKYITEIRERLEDTLRIAREKLTEGAATPEKVLRSES